MSPLPLVAWTVAWLIMANPSRNWRFAISAAVAAVSLWVGTFGVYGLIRDAHAQTPPAVNGKCNNFGSNNFNCTTLNVGPPHNPSKLYLLNGTETGDAVGIHPSADQSSVTFDQLMVPDGFP
jgi:hypothetical protein